MRSAYQMYWPEANHPVTGCKCITVQWARDRGHESKFGSANRPNEQHAVCGIRQRCCETTLLRGSDWLWPAIRGEAHASLPVRPGGPDVEINKGVRPMRRGP